MAKKQTLKKVTEKKVSAPVGTVKAEPKVVTIEKPKVGEAILMYQQDTTINENLSNGTLTDKQKECVEKLDKAMCPLADMELNRLVTKSVVKAYMEQTGAKTIDELSCKVVENVPFMSVTKNPLRDILEKRYHLGLDKPICIVIHTGLEGKVKGLDVMAELRDEGYENIFAQQKEIILARGQKFRVGKVAYGDEWGEAYPILHFYAV